MFKPYKQKSIKEAIREAEEEEIGRYKIKSRTGNLEKDSITYREQQTTEGQNILKSIEDMNEKLSKIIGKPLKSGRLHPLYCNGELTGYFES